MIKRIFRFVLGTLWLFQGIWSVLLSWLWLKAPDRGFGGELGALPGIYIKP